MVNRRSSSRFVAISLTYDPADAVDAELLQAIVMDQWRFRPHDCAEASLLTDLGGGENLGGAFLAAPQQLATLIRYHAEIVRSIHRNLGVLNAGGVK